MNLYGRRALVTGASSGIGAATALALTGTGAKLTLTGRDPTRLAQVAQRTGADSLPADLRDPEGLHQVLRAAAEVDLLVVSAGRGWAGDLVAMPDPDITALTELNLVVPLRLARAAVAGMRQRGYGHVVFVSSIAVVGVEREAVYSATKGGIRSFAAALRHEVCDLGLGVTTVLAGAVDTPFFSTRGVPYDRTFPRPLNPETVAEAIVTAVRSNRAEVFLPRWLTVAARINGLAPGLFHRLAHTIVKD